MTCAVAFQGAVTRSRSPIHRSACSRLAPHMSACGCSEAQTCGRSGWPKIRQRKASSSWMHFSPARLPPGMPGMGLVIEGAMQQAPQPGRQETGEGETLM